MAAMSSFQSIKNQSITRDKNQHNIFLTLITHACFTVCSYTKRKSNNLRHFNVRMDYRISIGISTMVPTHYRYHKFVTFYCKCMGLLYWIFSTKKVHTDRLMKFYESLVKFSQINLRLVKP